MNKLKRTAQIITFALLAGQATSALSWQWSDLFTREFWTPKRILIGVVFGAGVSVLGKLLGPPRTKTRRKTKKALFNPRNPSTLSFSAAQWSDLCNKFGRRLGFRLNRVRTREHVTENKNCNFFADINGKTVTIFLNGEKLL